MKAIPEADGLTGIKEHFELFEAAFPELGLYRRLAAGCAADPEVASLLLVARPGQARPVLLFAAVHELVLRRRDLDLARWYASVTPVADLAPDDAWPTFRRTVLEHRGELEEVIATRSTQTNEVNRSVLVAVLLAAACADVPDVPVHLVELGASAGLLLTPDRYRVDVGGVVVGDRDSPVHLAGEVHGSTHPDLSTFPRSFAERTGIDRDPMDITDDERVRWLEACLWPDQPWRIERFRAAVALARSDPPRLVAGDMIEVLGDVSAARRPGQDRAGRDHLIVMNLWTLTYVARSGRDEVVGILTDLAGEFPLLSWVHAEPPGCVPGIEPPPWGDDATRDHPESATPDTVLGVHRWRNGDALVPVTLGWSHPHGNWVHLQHRG